MYMVWWWAVGFFKHWRFLFISRPHEAALMIKDMKNT